MSDTDQPTQEPGKREAILEAALEVFAEVGYERATIKAIAARAGLKSPALLYWYFPSKADIMRAVMTRHMPLTEPTIDHALITSLPIELVLRQIAGGMLHAYDTDPRVALSMRLIFAEIVRQSEDSMDVLLAGPAVLLNLLRECLKASIERGELRPHDFEVSARMFMGSLIVYVLGTAVVPVMGVGLPSSAAFVEALISNLLDGLRPT
ncbi:MAG: TetR/AcrR family transcriptional regulator [Anaerolinea sp.]|nr:TetR/AcrR family transcriptional regulator [Anaerolinea sp.]